MDGSFKAAIDLSRSWAAFAGANEQGRDKSEQRRKTASAKKKFKTVDATTARRCLRSVGFRGSSQALIECENGSAYKCSDHSVSLVIKLDKIEPASFE